jgi:hypothetical protein
MNTTTIGTREVRVYDDNTLLRIHDVAREALKGHLTRMERERAEKTLLRTGTELRRRDIKTAGQPVLGR